MKNKLIAYARGFYGESDNRLNDLKEIMKEEYQTHVWNNENDAINVILDIFEDLFKENYRAIIRQENSLLLTAILNVIAFKTSKDFDFEVKGLYNFNFYPAIEDDLDRLYSCECGMPSELCNCNPKHEGVALKDLENISSAFESLAHEYFAPEDME